MIRNEYYTPDVHGPYDIFALGDFRLDCGVVLPNARLAYKTFGTLDAAGTNAILLLHGFAGTHARLQHWVRPGGAFDPDKYFVVLTNQLGNGLSSSPHNTEDPLGRGAFPKLSNTDDVHAQHRLLTEALGVKRLALVAGWSMGAQQTFEWCLSHPDMVERAAPIAGMARMIPYSRLVLQLARDAITSDPAWENGFYTEPHAVEEGLRRQARLWALLAVSADFYSLRSWERIGFASADAFIHDFMEAFFLPMDANNLVCLAEKCLAHDLSHHTEGDLKAALRRIGARMHVIAFDRDLIFPLSDCAAEQTMIPGSELHVVESPWGHDTMLGLFPEDVRAIDSILKELLSLPGPDLPTPDLPASSPLP